MVTKNSRVDTNGLFPHTVKPKNIIPSAVIAIVEILDTLEFVLIKSDKNNGKLLVPYRYIDTETNDIQDALVKLLEEKLNLKFKYVHGGYRYEPTIIDNTLVIPYYIQILSKKYFDNKDIKNLTFVKTSEIRPDMMVSKTQYQILKTYQFFPI